MPYYLKIRDDKKTDSRFLTFVSDGTGYSTCYESTEIDLTQLDKHELSIELTAQMNYMLGATLNDEV